MADIRCFIAIELPDGIKQELVSLIRQLCGAAPDARWVRREGMHLTLKFLGSVSEERIGEIEAALVEAVSGFGCIEARVESAGAFPHDDAARVLWAGVSDEAGRIRELASRIESAMAGLGFERETRPFKPHITVGRIKKPKRNRRLKAALASLKDREFGSLVAREVVLFKSQLHPDGAIYTPLARIPLER